MLSRDFFFDVPVLSFFSGFFSGKKKTQKTFQLCPELILYIKKSCMMMVRAIATILRDTMLNIVSRAV